MQYSLLPPGPHDPSFFDDPAFDEALRPVELTLALISRTEYYSKPLEIAIDSSVPHSDEYDDETSPLGDVEDPAFPTLYFAGKSHGVAPVRGKVSTLADGAVRWQFVSENVCTGSTPKLITPLRRSRRMTVECSGGEYDCDDAHHTLS